MKFGKIFLVTIGTFIIFAGLIVAQQNECKDIKKILEAQDISVKKSDVYESVKVCAVCHDVNYKAWSSGLMGKTHVSELYQKFFAEAIKAKGEEVEDNCRICHTPLYDKSENASEELLAEGVNCDFCHTIESVEYPKSPGSYLSTPSRIKKGSLDVAHSPYHPTGRNKVLEDPRFCASCHEWEDEQSGNKIIVEDTYSQYEDSSYGRTKRGCLACHMPEFEGKAANLDLAPRRNKIHQHTFTVKNKDKYIANAVELSIKPFIEKTQSITVIVNNKSQGHAFPGGANYFRHLILTIRGYDWDNKNIWTYRTTYGRWYQDKFGKKTYFPWMADKMVHNKILRPDRMDEATFRLTEKIKLAKVIATIDYWKMPPDLVKKYNLPIKPIRIHSTSRKSD